MANAKLISVWSPAGSVGRSTIALGVAAELADSGKSVFLLDADTHAPSINLMLGLTEHPAGLAAACRLVSLERFDAAELTRLSCQLLAGRGELTVMTGLSSAGRWSEITAEKLDELLMVAGEHFDYLVLDLASPLESQVVNSVDRNAVSRWAIGYSDLIIALCGADPISISRYLDSLDSIAQLNPKGELITVVNRLRNSVLGSGAKQQILETLARLGKVQVAAFIPDDSAAADSAIRGGVALTLGKRSSLAKQAIGLLVKSLVLAELNNLDKRVAKLN